MDNKDDPLTLDCMSVKLYAKYNRIYKKNSYDPENEEKIGKGKVITMAQHSRQMEMAYLEAGSLYVEIGGTKVTNAYS